MKILENKDKARVVFDSLADYRKKMAEVTGEDFDSKMISERRNDWHGTGTWQEFLDLLEDGDEAITKQIKELTGKAIQDYSKKYDLEVLRYNFDVTGEFFDIGLVMSGVPESWLQPEYGEVEKPKVDITINGSFPDGSDLKKLIKNASKILGIAKVVEDNGVLVSITCITGSKYFSNGDIKHIEMECSVKGYDEPINFAKCSSILSPTFLRRGCFKAMEMIAKSDIKDSYGQIIDIENSLELRNEDSIKRFEQKIFKK